MSDSSLDLLRRVGQQKAGQVEPLGDELEAACFGYLRGIRDRATELEIRRLQEGDSLSFPYNWLGPTRYHPSLGILLLFVGHDCHLVWLRGRNLNLQLESGISLYDRGLLRGRITWVREMSLEESKKLPSEACVIDRIEVAPILPDEIRELFGFYPLERASAGELNTRRTSVRIGSSAIGTAAREGAPGNKEPS